jgi:hypothetical protein
VTPQQIGKSTSHKFVMQSGEYNQYSPLRVPASARFDAKASLAALSHIDK